MRKLYKKLFYIPKHGKIQEKVLLTRVALTVVIMVVCLAAMSLTAYAWFSYNVTSGSNIIKAANFEATVSINITDANGEAVTVNKVDSKTQTADLKANVTYSVTLVESANSTAKTGFCVITAEGCSDVYHTQQFGNDKTVESNQLKVEFTLTVTEDTTIKILSHWGTSSLYHDYRENGTDNKLYITNDNNGDNAVQMVINSGSNLISESDEEKETASDETTATETTPTEDVYTVRSGDTLSKIATYYGTTAEKIAAYNQLTDEDLIQVGQQLKIPPEDWTIPADTTEQTTTTPETTQPADTTPSETTGTSEPTDTTEPSTSTADPTATQSTETSATETTGTDPTEQTQQSETETSETTGAPTTEVSEE